MRKLLWLLCVSFAVFAGDAIGQGLVFFANGPTTLISNWVQSPPPIRSWGAPGAYFFALLISPSPTGPFRFTGAYSTNTVNFGHLGPSSYTPAVPGWAAGQTMYYEVAGWSASLGPVFSPAWLNGQGFGNYGLFGLSGVASGIAGGGPNPPIPPLQLFAGNGLAGFSLLPVGSPPTVPIPDLKIVPNGDELVLVWDLPSQNFVLQQSTNLANAAGWTDAAVTPTVDYATARNEMALPRPSGNIFYRLAR